MPFGEYDRAEVEQMQTEALEYVRLHGCLGWFLLAVHDAADMESTQIMVAPPLLDVSIGGETLDRVPPEVFALAIARATRDSAAKVARGLAEALGVPDA